MWTKWVFRLDFLKVNCGKTIRIAFYLSRGTFWCYNLFVRSLMFQFCFRNFTEKCLRRALTHAFFVSRWKISGKKFFSCDQNTFFNYSFGDYSLAVLSELLSDCPVHCLDGKNFWKGLWCIFFCENWQEIFRLFSRNYFLRV